VHNRGKKSILGVLVDALDYEAATEFVLRAARERRGAAISALAVHGVMAGVLDREQKFRLNHFDLLAPDGQPVRWALNLLYRAGLSDRVYGPNLTLGVCERACQEKIPVYFYGSTPEILTSLREALAIRFPGIQMAGMEPSRFRRLTREEKRQLADRIAASGARILFVGLGCPRQEIFAFEFRNVLRLPILAVGAAFPFLAGKIAQAPPWMQRVGLEWLFRLACEPRRLWRRYVLLNPAYSLLLLAQALRILRFNEEGTPPHREILFG
jgi:N-acetylglucosaminyldiphosphoundecaprenol N-acetyl-beta-D-mannosaminyltransferase